MKLASIAILVSFAANVFAGGDHMQPVKVSADFEKLKSLVGTWQGTGKMHGKDETFKATYELTSGGTAIVEKTFAGTPHEMVTVYANHGQDILVTHYCAMGNQPEFHLKKASNGTFAFEMDGTKGLNDKNEMHMHGVTLTLNNDKLKQEWTNYDHGKKGEQVVFEFTKTN